MSIRVLLVDDHQMLRVGLCTMIEGGPDIEVVGEAADGATAVELTRHLHPDVVLMDIQLPGLNGVEATRRIVREMPDVKVIMLTMYREENQALEALRVGAMGYLHKDTNHDELLGTIRSVAAGQAMLTPQLAAGVLKLLHNIDGSEPARTDAEETELTEREILLLRAVAHGQSNKEMALELGLSIFTVRNQLSDIYRKIQVADRTQAAMYAVENGLI